MSVKIIITSKPLEDARIKYIENNKKLLLKRKLKFQNEIHRAIDVYNMGEGSFVDCHNSITIDIKIDLLKNDDDKSWFDEVLKKYEFKDIECFRCYDKLIFKYTK